MLDELHGDLGVLDGGKNLRAIPDDPRIVHELLNFVIGELTDDVWREVRERGAKRLSTSQNGDP